MTADETKDIILAWNEVEEAHCSLNELNDEEVISCLDAIKKRLRVAMDLLGKYFTDKALMELIEGG